MACVAFVLKDKYRDKDRLVYRGFCSCGCGELIFQKYCSPSNLKNRGEKRFVRGHQCRGRKVSLDYRLRLKNQDKEKTPNWKGGRRIDSYGYVLILNKNHPYADNNGYVREHRLVMEEKIGRFLSSKETIHHKNGIKEDNRIENLELFEDISAHISFEYRDKIGPYTKLTKENVKEIKELLNREVKFKAIAEMFGVTEQCIRLIKNKKTWRTV